MNTARRKAAAVTPAQFASVGVLAFFVLIESGIAARLSSPDSPASDLTLGYSTYLGGAGDDESLAVVADAAGNAYVAGITRSDDFPVTTSRRHAGDGDVFVMKLDSTGSRILFSTYVGGTGRDVARAIAVDRAGVVYVTGQTASSDFPTTAGALQSTSGGGVDAFLFKLSPTGAIIYSTYIGGSGTENGRALTVDQTGRMYVVGRTASNNFRTVVPVQATHGGGPYDAFFLRVSATGSTLEYASYLGGGGDDGAYGVVVDTDGRATIAGYGDSVNFPVRNAIQPMSGGSYDALIFKIAADGTLIYSTYLGGSESDYALAVTADSSGDVYITGGAFSANFPVVRAVRPHAGGEDAFISKLSRDGTTLLFSTPIGGNLTDLAFGIAWNPNTGHVFIAGRTGSTDFPLAGPIQPAYGGGSSDSFVTGIDVAASRIVSSTYLGGSAYDSSGATDTQSGGGIAIIGSSVYVTGFTSSTDFPVARALQGTKRGGFDAFLVRLDDPSPAPPPTPPTPPTPTPPPPPSPPSNQPPTITGIANLTIEENQFATTTFTVADDATAPAALIVTASSSNATLLPNSHMVLGGNGPTRTLAVTPALDRRGQATISISVSDGVLTTTAQILLTVTAASPPQPPTALRASVAGTTVTFTWTAPALGAVPTFYILEGGSNSGATTTLPVINTRSRVTSWTTTLVPGTYVFRVRSANSGGISGISNEIVINVGITGEQPPGPPNGFVVSVNASQVNFVWQHPDIGGPVAHWQLELGSAPRAVDRGVFPIPAAMASVSGSLPDGFYVARVRGVNIAGVGPTSNETRFSVGAVSGCTGSVPDAPVLLPATLAGGVITLLWVPPANAPVTAYQLFVGSVAGAADLAILDLGPGTSFAGNAPPGRYHFTVRALNACGMSALSNSVEALATGLPSAPGGVRASVSGSTVTIAWELVLGATSYVLEAGTTPGASNVAVQQVADTMFTATDVPSGRYYLRVRASGTGGTSAPSEEIVITVP